MADYPHGWEADVVLADGGTCHLRPIRPDDAGLLVEMFQRLSPETIYRRFFMPRRELAPREVERFTTVDHVERVALIATLHGEMVAVGRYERLPGSDEAEVAFVVEDAHQGRGIGSALLEHLAAAARERGVRRFLAEVLPGNRAMVGVFTDAGYEARRSYGDGVVTLTFPIEPTELSERVRQAREHRAESRSVERVLWPRSVAVIGAGREPASVGQLLLRNVVGYGFTGEVHAVNPAAGEIAGVPSYGSVADVPGPVDLAVVATPAEQVEDVVRQCAAKGVHGIVVVSAGFAEAGEEGRAAQRRLVALARESGMRLIGPNCLGVLNTDEAVRLNATLAPVIPERGRIGFFCHAGALGVAILEQLAERGAGLSTFVSAGNRADVSGNDLLQLWEDDPATDVVLLYLESFGNPRKFGRLARRVGRSKPVVAVRSGRSAAVDALFRQAGVVRVDTLAQLLDMAVLLAGQPLPRGPRVAIVGNSSALTALAADACLGNGLSAVSVVDVGIAGTADDVAGALGSALADDGVDAVVAVLLPPIPPLPVAGAELAEALARAGAGARKPMVATYYGFAGRSGAPGTAGRAGRAGRAGTVGTVGTVPSYASPEAAVLALGRAVAYAQWRAAPPGRVPEPGVPAGAGRAVVERALARGGGALERDETAELLAAHGIALLPAQPAASAEEVVAAADRLGYPVAVKSTAAHLRHRPDLGGVRLDLAGAAEARAAWSALAELGGDAVVVQPMAPAGVPVVIGVSEDPSFGAIVSFGIGGVATDLLGDVGHRSLPLTDADAAALVRSVRAAPLLSGYRGSEPVDVPALEDLLLRVAHLADDLEDVAQLVLNPVLVSPKGLAVVDAAARVARAPGPLDAGPRRMR
ncbi:MAG: GNAT family N-acetyltransferase [Frankiaceae bacterium]